MCVSVSGTAHVPRHVLRHFRKRDVDRSTKPSPATPNAPPPAAASSPQLPLPPAHRPLWHTPQQQAAWPRPGAAVTTPPPSPQLPPPSRLPSPRHRCRRTCHRLGLHPGHRHVSCRLVSCSLQRYKTAAAAYGCTYTTHGGVTMCSHGQGRRAHVVHPVSKPAPTSRRSVTGPHWATMHRSQRHNQSVGFVSGLCSEGAHILVDGDFGPEEAHSR